MNAIEYLRHVQNTICTHGHRGIAQFQVAAQRCDTAIRANVQQQSMLLEECLEVRNLIKEGLITTFNPNHAWFSAAAGASYGFLLADYNSIGAGASDERAYRFYFMTRKRRQQLMKERQQLIEKMHQLDLLTASLDAVGKQLRQAATCPQAQEHLLGRLMFNVRESQRIRNQL